MLALFFDKPESSMYQGLIILLFTEFFEGYI